MSATESRADLRRRGLVLEYLTIGWNAVEAVVAVWAGIAVGSIALATTITWRPTGVDGSFDLDAVLLLEEPGRHVHDVGSGPPWRRLRTRRSRAA